MDTSGLDRQFVFGDVVMPTTDIDSILPCGSPLKVPVGVSYDRAN